MQSKYLRTLIGALALTSLAAIAQEKAPDLGPTQGLLSEAKPTFVVSSKDLPRHWTLIAYGDTRFTDPVNVKPSNPTVRRWLVDKIAGEHPDAVLVTGDLPWHGLVADYTQFQSETSSWRAAKLRVYPVLGNHELAPNGTEGVHDWWAEFPALNQRRWYSVQFGDAYLIGLDSNLPLAAGSPQQSWLDAQLRLMPRQTRFVFIMLHHPPVADNGPHERHNLRPNEIAFSEYLNEKQKTVKARFIVIAGHTHNYERFNRSGITYLVSGGGGADPYPVERAPDDLYQDKGFPNYHYIRFVFDGSKLTATMMRVADPSAFMPTWEAKDTFTIDPKP